MGVVLVLCVMLLFVMAFMFVVFLVDVAWWFIKDAWEIRKWHKKATEAKRREESERRDSSTDG